MKDYLDDYNVNEKKESIAFEHFCNYTLFTHNCPDAYKNDKFLYKTVHTGDGGDNAIDGILITVNDIVVTNMQQLKDVIDKRRFEASFFFVQAKTSSCFDSGEMLKTGIGVQDFFKNDFAEFKGNKKVKKYKEMADYIFSQSLYHKHSPLCYIYFATCGKWIEDAHLMSVRQKCEDMIFSLNYFGQVKYIPIDAVKLSSIYKEISNAISREILISRAVSFPPNIKGVDNAYLGLVSADEYLKLITDEDGYLQNGLFYENVRSYLGENPVNKEIADTICDNEKYIQFPILNNGVTIVTKSLRPSGDKYTLTDFQIVNGCQTSNEIYRNRESIKSDMMLPIKIVCTDNPELINDVIRTTNRQTQVLDEAFESLKTFHKQLQDFYNSFKTNDRIYYERRSHEYDSNTDKVKRSNVVSMTIQLYAFISMFMGEPHSVHRYYGEILKAYRQKVFQPEHILFAYYVSAWTLHKIEDAIRKGEVAGRFRKYRYHFLFMIQIYIRKILKMKELPRMNSNAMERFCNKIYEVVSDSQNMGAMLRLFSDMIIKSESEMKNLQLGGNHFSHIKEFTLNLQSKVEQSSI